MQNNKNFWGPADDEESLPEWMDPRTYQNNNQYKRKTKSLNEAINDALKKPAVPIILEEVAVEIDKMRGDTAMSFATFVRNMKR